MYKVIKCYDSSSSHSGRQNFFALKEIVIKDKGQCMDIVVEHATFHKIRPHRNLLRLVEAFYISDPRIVYFATTPWAPVFFHRFLENVLEGHFRPWYKSNTLGQWSSIFLQCLDGLKHLHNSYKQLITHNDLKSHNILLLAENEDEGCYVRPIIADFGLCGRSHTGNIKNIGTKKFMSSEQAEGEEPTVKSDIWALGCCFALVLVLLLSDQAGLRNLWKVIMSSKVPRKNEIAKNIEKVFSIIEKLPQSDSLFVRQLKSIVEDMLKILPKERPIIKPVRQQLEEAQRYDPYTDTECLNNLHLRELDQLATSSISRRFLFEENELRKIWRLDKTDNYADADA